MKKSIWIFLLLFCVLCVNSDAAVIVFGGGAAEEGGGGGTPTEVITQTTTNYSTLSIYNTQDTVGQNFEAVDSNKLYSITVNFTGWNGSPNIKMRFGTQGDMSSVYTEEVSDSTSGTGEHEFVFIGQPQLSSGTQYYFAIRNGDKLYGDRVTMATNTTSVYAGGSGNNHSSNFDDWGGASGGGDLYFRIKTIE